MNDTEDQRSGRNKSTVVNKTYIKSGAYRRKFDSISSSRDLNRLLYQLARKMLLHRSGTLYEDMYWVDMDTLHVVAEETHGNAEETIIYSSSTIQAIETYPHILTIHSHPGSFPPSISDLNSNYEHGYQFGVVACHNGDIYVYESSQYIRENYYNLVVAGFLKRGYTEVGAQRAALMELQHNFEIHYMEVTNDGI